MAGPLLLTLVACLGGNDWPMRRHDPILSGRADASGRLRDAPRCLWTFSDPTVEVELEIRVGNGNAGETIDVEPGKLPAPFHEELDAPRPGKKKWRRQTGAPLVDLHGDGRLVPDPGKAAPLVPGVKGLQTVSFEPVRGAEAALTQKAVCHAYDQASPRVVWTSEGFDTVQNTNHIVADVDGDGQLEVVLAPHYRVIVLDGASGRTKHVLRFHDLRNYGFFCAVNLDDDPQIELVVIADFVLHLDVIDMDSKGPRLLWRRDIEEDIQSKRRILRPGPDPVFDADGDGRKEIVVNLYNDSKDGLWHVVAFDALTGEKRLDLPGRYLEGHGDLDGDGREELLVTECPSLYVPRAGTVDVVSSSRGESPSTVTRWSRPGSRFVSIERSLPLTHSTIVARGTETAAIVGMGPGRSMAFVTVAAEAGSDVLRLVEPGRAEAALESSLPLGRELAVRGAVDADAEAGAESGAALRVTLRARPAEHLRLPAPKGGALRAVSARPVVARPARGSNSDGWITVGSWAGRPAVFAENELGEVLAVRIESGGAPGVVWRDHGRGPVVLADIDGDGASEAIFADESASGEGRIVAAGPGGRNWMRAIDGFPGPNPAWNYGGITQWWVGRLTSRDRFDVFASARRGTMHTDEAFVLRGTDGVPLWQRSEVRTPNMAPATRGWGCGGGALNAVDVDGDGLDDLLSLYPVNYSALKGSTGEVIRSADASSGLFAGVWGAYATPCALDLDGDGRREVLWSGPYHQGVTDLEGKVRWFVKGATSVATACDLDGDGRLEVASTGWESGGKGLRALDARTGELRWEMPLDGNPRVPLTAAQLDGEGGDDLLFATGGNLRAVTLRDGALWELWSVPIPSEPLGEVAFADADGDGFGEALFVGRDGVVYAYGVQQKLSTPGDKSQPIHLHPENPHYFEWRGKPTVLITSTEHYGAVLNPDFEYVAYLDTLKAAGLNLTRTVNGDFLESTSATLWRGGDQNPLAPREGRYLAPWARSGEPGYYFGGNKFDLDRWDENYFRRLKDFVHAASDRGIVVEFNAFYVLYDEGPIKGSWVLHPLNSRNNVNGVGNIPWHRYNTLADPGVVAQQDALLRKTLTELNDFDNVYYEVCDEPYFSGASPAETAAWQNHMIDTFVAAEGVLPKKHLIAVNFANGSIRVEKPHPAISVFNFHYCSPPDAVPMNWDFAKPIVFDETAGHGGHVALDRRREAWAFLLSGGAGYDNLDPSFATDDPTGSGKVMQADGRYDCRDVRAQLGVLKKFLESLDLIHMRPNQHLLRPWPHSPSELFYALELPGKSYAVYFRGGDKPRRTKFSMDLPAGRWQAEWVAPRDGSVEKPEPFQHPGGGWLTETPEFTEDIALRLTSAAVP